MGSIVRHVRQECRPTEDAEIDAVYGTTIVVGRAAMHPRRDSAHQSATAYRPPVGALHRLDSISVTS
jgi:hypothetical protein